MEQEIKTILAISIVGIFLACSFLIAVHYDQYTADKKAEKECLYINNHGLIKGGKSCQQY